MLLCYNSFRIGDCMNGGYYDNEIRKEQEKIELYVLGMRVAIDSIEYSAHNKDRARKNIYNLVEKLIVSDNSKKSKVVGAIGKALKNELKEAKRVSYSMVSKRVEARKPRIEDYDKLTQLANKIASNPALALVDYANKYVAAVYKIEQLIKSKEGAKKKEAQANPEHIDAQGPTSYTYSNPEVPRTPEYQYSRPVASNNTAEALVSLLEEKLNRGEEFLSREEVNYLLTAFPELDDYGTAIDYYSVQNLKNLYKIEVFRKGLKSNRNAFKLDDIVKIGELVYEALAADLLNGRSQNATKSARLLRIFETDRLLERYQEAYNDYLSYYNGLDDKTRADLDELYRSHRYDMYKVKFNIHGDSAQIVATVEDVKRVANSLVKSTLIDSPDYLSILFDDETQSFNGAHRIAYATKFMTVEEIARLYKEIENQQVGIMDSFESEKTEDFSSAKEGLKKFQESLQANFANAIRYRMTNSILKPNATEEEREEFRVKRDMDLVAICREYFHEEPFFSVKYTEKKEVGDKRAARRLETGEAIERAQIRFYGMNKMQQALSRMNLAKLNQLGQKDILTDDEIRLVNKMF